MEPWQKPETITLWVIITVLFLVLLLTFIAVLVRLIFKKIIRTKIAEAEAETKYQEDLLKTSITVQENERKRIASDIHDALIGKLIAIKIHQENNSDITKYSDLIDTSIELARNISHDLSPPILEYTSLVDLVKEMIDPLKLKTAVQFNIDQRVQYEYTTDFKIQVIRILQELFNNIIKHAKASQVIICLRETKKQLFIKIADNGEGFSTGENAKGLGLKNIKSRVQYLKGAYKVKSKPLKGTVSLLIFKEVAI
ncbi:sensor histidine kinase [Ulvibacter litoralis]|uniref:histidine kinase n=1 Tax=Ulvibacter litoralis TaxID=227084 RepID=A0A1G7D1F3_9FLAO|nr:ATP-binding protein [Ulvibacter litoralis]SDE45524.1 Histidine kinase-, DNA gyrase B-, and HSP90-like ATPase [Ulvibacter litoralis]